MQEKDISELLRYHGETLILTQPISHKKLEVVGLTRSSDKRIE